MPKVRLGCPSPHCASTAWGTGCHALVGVFRGKCTTSEAADANDGTVLCLLFASCASTQLHGHPDRRGVKLSTDYYPIWQWVDAMGKAKMHLWHPLMPYVGISLRQL